MVDLATETKRSSSTNVEAGKQCSDGNDMMRRHVVASWASPCVFGKRRQSTRLFEDRPDEWLEEDQQGFDEHGWMDDVQGLDVLLVPGNERESFSFPFLDTFRFVPDTEEVRPRFYVF